MHASAPDVASPEVPIAHVAVSVERPTVLVVITLGQPFAPVECVVVPDVASPGLPSAV